MTHEEMVRTLSMALPEDIESHKRAGYIDEAIRLIDLRLTRALPEMLRCRLIVERERLTRLIDQYPYDHASAIEALGEIIPNATAADLKRFEDMGLADFIYVNGEKRYFVRFHASLSRQPELMTGKGASPFLDPMIAELKEKGVLTRRITVDVENRVEPADFVPGHYRAWLPYPLSRDQQREVTLLSGDPSLIAPETAPARTLYFERDCDTEAVFRARYSYVSRIVYADPLHRKAPDAPLYPSAPAPTPDDLREELPFIRFTPYLRSLCEELCAGLVSDVEKAWAIYRFITERVRYTFMRDYFSIDHLGEYCAINLRGDCGLQALLFINLCRIAGIPARWQSGMSVGTEDCGSHDWAQFYLPGWGWLFADPSYGGGAFKAGAKVRHAFYFGNIDPMRLAANCRFEADLTPTMNAFRVDPYDNQSGEIERVGALVALSGRQQDDTRTTVSIEAL